MPIVGEGAHGCVYKPLLKCKNNTAGNNSYVYSLSKITSEEEAKNEDVSIKFLSKHEELKPYILYKSMACKADENNENIATAIKSCKTNKSYVFNNNFTPQKAWLFQMERGGVTMNYFIQNIMKNRKYRTLKKRIKFLKAIGDIIHCLELFQKHGFMHCDIKLDNILFGAAVYSDVKIIDFGLAHKIDDYKKESRNGPVFVGKSNDYTPPEMEHSSENTFNEYFKEKETTHENCNCIKCEIYKGYTKDEYDTFLDDSAKTFDSYSLAFWLHEMFKYFSTNDLFKDFSCACIKLMKKYFIKNVKNREKNLSNWQHEYNNLFDEFNDLFTISDKIKKIEKKEYLKFIANFEKKITETLSEDELNKLIKELHERSFQYVEKVDDDTDDSIYDDYTRLDIILQTKKQQLAKNEVLPKYANAKEAANAEAEKNRLKEDAEAKIMAKKAKIEAWKKARAAKEAHKKQIKPFKGGKTKRKPKLRTRNKKLRSNKKRRHGKKTYKKRKTTSRK